MSQSVGAILFLVVAIVVASFIFVYTPKNPQAQILGTVEQKSAGQTDYAKIAADVAEKINQISPTQSMGNVGWIAELISFVPNQPLAYIEYTDTHVTLRLLLEYEYKNTEISIKVLGTFEPNEQGNWQLVYGTDPGAKIPVLNYVYNAEKNEWVADNNSF